MDKKHLAKQPTDLSLLQHQLHCSHLNFLRHFQKANQLFSFHPHASSASSLAETSSSLRSFEQLCRIVGAFLLAKLEFYREEIEKIADFLNDPHFIAQLYAPSSTTIDSLSQLTPSSSFKGFSYNGVYFRLFVSKEILNGLPDGQSASSAWLGSAPIFSVVKVEDFLLFCFPEQPKETLRGMELLSVSNQLVDLNSSTITVMISGKSPVIHISNQFKNHFFSTEFRTFSPGEKTKPDTEGWVVSTLPYGGWEYKGPDFVFPLKAQSSLTPEKASAVAEGVSSGVWSYSAFKTLFLAENLNFFDIVRLTSLESESDWPYFVMIAGFLIDFKLKFESKSNTSISNPILSHRRVGSGPATFLACLARGDASRFENEFSSELALLSAAFLMRHNVHPKMKRLEFCKSLLAVCKTRPKEVVVELSETLGIHPEMVSKICFFADFCSEARLKEIVQSSVDLSQQKISFRFQSHTIEGYFWNKIGLRGEFCKKNLSSIDFEDHWLKSIEILKHFDDEENSKVFKAYGQVLSILLGNFDAVLETKVEGCTLVRMITHIYRAHIMEKDASISFERDERIREEFAKALEFALKAFGDPRQLGVGPAPLLFFLCWKVKASLEQLCRVGKLDESLEGISFPSQSQVSTSKNPFSVGAKQGISDLKEIGDAVRARGGVNTALIDKLRFLVDSKNSSESTKECLAVLFPFLAESLLCRAPTEQDRLSLQEIDSIESPKGFLAIFFGAENFGQLGKANDQKTQIAAARVLGTRAIAGETGDPAIKGARTLAKLPYTNSKGTVKAGGENSKESLHLSRRVLSAVNSVRKLALGHDNVLALTSTGLAYQKSVRLGL